MARNAIESEFRTSKMADQSEMARNAIQSEFRKFKMVDRSEMARNAIESEFRTSKMADVSHFVKKIQKKIIKLYIDLKWIEMRLKVNFGHPKWPTSAILSKISKKIKVAYRSEMARNAIESEIRASKMADVSHFVKNFKKKLRLRIDVKWIEMRSKVIFGHPNGHRQPFCMKKFKKKKYMY